MVSSALPFFCRCFRRQQSDGRSTSIDSSTQDKEREVPVDEKPAMAVANCIPTLLSSQYDLHESPSIAFSRYHLLAGESAQLLRQILDFADGERTGVNDALLAWRTMSKSDLVLSFEIARLPLFAEHVSLRFNSSDAPHKKLQFYTRVLRSSVKELTVREDDNLTSDAVRLLLKDHLVETIETVNVALCENISDLAVAHFMICPRLRSVNCESLSWI